MRLISTNDGFNAYRASGCTLCKYYWLATLGAPGGSYETLHASRGEACARAELDRDRGIRFCLIEMPALFFPCDDGSGSVLGAAGLLITEERGWSPMAVHGAVSVQRPDVRSIVSQFVRDPENLVVRRTSVDMPALVGPLRAWNSRSKGPRRPLDWHCINRAVAIDLSHLDSLRMRLDQQIRGLAGAVASGMRD